MLNLLNPRRTQLIKILYGLGILVFYKQGIARCINEKRLEYHKLLVQGKKKKWREKSSGTYLKYMKIYIHIWEFYPRAILLLLQGTRVTGIFPRHSFSLPGVLLSWGAECVAGIGCVTLGGVSHLQWGLKDHSELNIHLYGYLALHGMGLDDPSGPFQLLMK